MGFPIRIFANPQIQNLRICWVGSKGAWRISVLCVLPARPAVIEDEDGDLTMERRETDGGVRIDPSIAGAADAVGCLHARSGFVCLRW